jgi:hypothetical protein
VAAIFGDIGSKSYGPITVTQPPYEQALESILVTAWRRLDGRGNRLVSKFDDMAKEAQQTWDSKCATQWPSGTLMQGLFF